MDHRFADDRFRGVYLRLLVDPPRHVRLSHADSELIDRAAPDQADTRRLIGAKRRPRHGRRWRRPLGDVASGQSQSGAGRRCSAHREGVEAVKCCDHRLDLGPEPLRHVSMWAALSDRDESESITDPGRRASGVSALGIDRAPERSRGLSPLRQRFGLLGGSLQR